MSRTALFCVIVAVTNSVAIASDERPGVAPTKTWDLIVPADFKSDKLPLTGPVPDNWEKPEFVKSGYLTTKEQLAELWKALAQDGKPPEVDFAKESVVLIQIQASRLTIGGDEGEPPVLRFAIAAIGKGAKTKTFVMATFPKAEIEKVVTAAKKKK
jgi:hypothetical protein